MPLRRLARIALVLFALAPWVSSCRPSPSSLAPGDAENPIAPEFKSLWEKAGGLATFGPPLETARRDGAVVGQTFLAVQLTYDARDRERPVRLAPLGLKLGLAEPAEPQTALQNGEYFPETGHTLYAGFAPLFDALGGLEIVGPPITEVHFRNGRITQYFENLGMVRPENASPSEVRLVALGLAALPAGSAFGQEVDSVLLPGTVLRRPFSEALEAFGGEATLGQPLSDPYVAEDGALEQVYERVVVYGEGPSSTDVRFRPIGRQSGAASPAVPMSAEAGAIYDEATGHNIQWAFADFYRANRGRLLLGAPLEEARLEGARLLQTFENGGLVYDYDLPPDLAVQLAPLGEAFLAGHPEPASSPTVEQPPSPTATLLPPALSDNLFVQVTLERLVVASSGTQNVTVTLLDSNGDPMAGVRPTIAWYSADESGSDVAPATDAEGRTTIGLQVEGRPFEIITVYVSARVDGRRGAALVQYAIGWTLVR